MANGQCVNLNLFKITWNFYTDLILVGGGCVWSSQLYQKRFGMRFGLPIFSAKIGKKMS